jgi:uncharacterized protein with PIN domain
MEFVADCMLGKLAKWLKILGFDVLYFPKIEDKELLARARKEGRILLSRDHALLDRARELKKLFIESEAWEDQVRQVLNHFKLWGEVEPYTRCLGCNAKLRPLPKAQAANLVAPFVFQKADSFAICPSCGQVFWPGTHFDDMEDKLAEILERKKPRV